MSTFCNALSCSIFCWTSFFFQEGKSEENSDVVNDVEGNEDQDNVNKEIMDVVDDAKSDEIIEEKMEGTEPTESIKTELDENEKNFLSVDADDHENENENENEENTSNGDEDEDDDQGWITPGNISKVKKDMGFDELDDKEVDAKSACLTTDFAMQVFEKRLWFIKFCFPAPKRHLESKIIGHSMQYFRLRSWLPKSQMVLTRANCFFCQKPCHVWLLIFKILEIMKIRMFIKAFSCLIVCTKILHQLDFIGSPIPSEETSPLPFMLIATILCSSWPGGYMVIK